MPRLAGLSSKNKKGLPHPMGTPNPFFVAVDIRLETEIT